METRKRRFSLRRMRLHVVINPRSGEGAGRHLAERLARFEPFLLNEAEEAEALGTTVAAGDVVVVGGGDGTVSLIVKTLFRQGRAADVGVLVLPLGTGNDLAHCLGLTLPPDPVRLLADFRPGSAARHEVAVWQMGSQYFVNYASFGLDAQILATADRWRPHLPLHPGLRKIALGVAGLRHPFYRIEDEVVLRTDDRAQSLQGLCGVILSNIGYIVGGSRVGELAPAAPRLSVTEVRSSMDLIRLFLSRLGGPQPILPYTSATSVRIEGEALPVELDGEVATFEPGRIACAGTVTFLVPE